MSATFTPSNWSVSALTDSVENGSIKLPDLQRPFVWGRSKVRDLFDSMYRGYPVGQLMFWQRPHGENEGRAIGDAGQVSSAHQIIDGQQRLTSLYAVVKGKPVRDANYTKISIKIAFDPFSEKFEVQNAPILKSSNWIPDISEVFKDPFGSQQNFIDRFENASGPLSVEQRRKLQSSFIRLQNLANYSFTVVTLLQSTSKETVSDIFVRINSQGAMLISADFILTWLSVFWPEGRDEIEAFARNSHLTSTAASELAGRKVKWTPLNHFLKIDAGQIVRLVVAYGQNRGKLSDAYSALQARTREGFTDQARQDIELGKLKTAVPVVLDPMLWDEFWRALQIGGFRSRKMVTSDNNLLVSYLMFLIGRKRFGVELYQLRTAIARWFFMSQLTGRYTGSPETVIQKELDALAELDESSAESFLSYLSRVISSELSDDYWSSRMPELLVASVPGLSPTYQAYLASLNLLKAQLFMTRMNVVDWCDPTLTSIKGTELHHIFPRAHLERTYGIRDIKRFNQIANFAPTDWDTNLLISDRDPVEYWPELLKARGGDAQWLETQVALHAMPENWHLMQYEDFLNSRRKLIAQVTRQGFDSIELAGGIPIEYATDEDLGLKIPSFPTDIVNLIEQGLLVPGEILTDIDPNISVEAFVTSDSTVIVNGQSYDSLDQAAVAAGAVNLSGLEFWARLVDGEPCSLAQIFER